MRAKITYEIHYSYQGREVSFQVPGFNAGMLVLRTAAHPMQLVKVIDDEETLIRSRSYVLEGGKVNVKIQ